MFLSFFLSFCFPPFKGFGVDAARPTPYNPWSAVCKQMGRTKQTGRMEQARMHIGTSKDGLLQLNSVTDVDSDLLSNGLGYGGEDTLHTGKLKRSVVLEIYNAEIDSMDARDEITEIAYKFNVPYEKVLAIKNGELYAKYTVHAKAMKSDVTIDDVRDSLDLMYKEYDKLELEHDGLRVIYDELQVEKDEIQEEKDELEVTNTELEHANGILQMENSTLLMTNDDLKSKLTFQNRKLNAKINRLETLLRISKEALDS